MTETPAYTSYMLETATEHQAQIAAALIENEKIFSDDTGMSNAAKWERVVEVFRADKATLFSRINLNEVYRDDEARTAEAASYICELRAQFFKALLAEEQENALYHIFYVQNRQWQVRMRERAGLTTLTEAASKFFKAF